ncbi:hypothetical protein ES703_125166 [subsurface metagenome]
MSIRRNCITGGWPIEIPGRLSSNSTFTAGSKSCMRASTAAMSSLVQAASLLACVGVVAAAGAATPSAAITSCSIQRRTSGGAERICSTDNVIPIIGSSPRCTLGERPVLALMRIKSGRRRSAAGTCCGPAHGATSSTRRFSARPASVAFVPTGARNPTPAVRRRCGAIRYARTSSAATASALRRDKSRL